MKTRLINRTERLTAIEQMLFRSEIGLRAVEIAEACGVDRRTIEEVTTDLNKAFERYQKAEQDFLKRWSESK